ncbi:hypothetical protein BGZ63DRAFT_3107 [Mariannaea sp. PMI_226]|nr:hypothetical protein BGZ63DRAFT_3107 [Mariannaea sp. PMI_226]
MQMYARTHACMQSAAGQGIMGIRDFPKMIDTNHIDSSLAPFAVRPPLGLCGVFRRVHSSPEVSSRSAHTPTPPLLPLLPSLRLPSTSPPGRPGVAWQGRYSNLHTDGACICHDELLCDRHGLLRTFPACSRGCSSFHVCLPSLPLSRMFFLCAACGCITSKYGAMAAKMSEEDKRWGDLALLLAICPRGGLVGGLVEEGFFEPPSYHDSCFLRNKPPVCPVSVDM